MLLRLFLPAIAVLATTGCAADEPKPEIVTIFACSDLCPGPVSSHLRQVYKDVNDAQRCKALGGHPFFVTGWGTRMHCGVQGVEVNKLTADDSSFVKAESRP